MVIYPNTLKYIDVQYMKYSGVSLTSWGGVSLAAIGHPSKDGVTIKMSHGVDFLLH